MKRLFRKTSSIILLLTNLFRILPYKTNPGVLFPRETKYHPWCVIDDNCQANVGLEKIFVGLQKTLVSRKNALVTFCVDVGIFWRLLRVTSTSIEIKFHLFSIVY
jgi:hypothetical protein